MAKQPPAPPQAPIPQASSLSFTQGFLLGQLSIALLIFFFIKFFIFGEPPSADDRALHLASLRRARTLAHQSTVHQRTRSNSITQPLHHKTSRSIIRNQATSSGPSIATILAKTYYNVKGHQPESLDWFNVLVAQTIAQLRADARHDDAVLTSLTEVLNNGSKPDWIGEIRVTEIALGDEFPIFSNCRVMPAEDGFGVGVGSSGGDDGRLQARMDVDLSDVITLGIETTLVLNYPKPLVAVLPVALAVSVVRFSGTLAVSFIPSSTPSASSSNPHPNKAQAADPPSHPSTSSSSTPSRPTSLAFTFLDDYRLDLSVRSLVGSRSRLQDVPKIAQLIESRVHAWFDERVVEPRFQQIVLPSLWPRKRNTRGGEDEENLPSTVPAASSISLGLNEDSSAVVDDEAEASQTETETDGLRIKSATAPTTRNKPANTPSALEARMAAEGAKLREAETRAGERSRAEESAGIRRRGEQQRFGDRLHRSDASRPTLPSRFSGEWSGQRGMPGAMPGG